MNVNLKTVAIKSNTIEIKNNMKIQFLGENYEFITTPIVGQFRKIDGKIWIEWSLDSDLNDRFVWVDDSNDEWNLIKDWIAII